jgi:RNA polymerase sigma-70 factor, ECF subfamily
VKDRHDERWLEELWTAHAGRLRAYLQRRVATADVDDLLSEVFLVAWRHRKQKPNADLPWLYGIARKVVSTHYRASERRGRLRTRIEFEGRSGISTWMPSSHLELSSALEALEPDDREILLLSAWEGLTPSEIAKALGTTSPAMRMRLSRARKRFESLFSDHDPNFEGARR